MIEIKGGQPISGGSGTSASIMRSLIGTHYSPNDFTAAYTSGSTITLAGHPTITDSSQIVGILVIPTSGTPKIYLNGVSGIRLTYATNVISISGVTNPFATGDIYQIVLRLQDKSFDTDLKIQKIEHLFRNGTHYSPHDFSATYTSNVTITLSGHPTITDSSQIVGIMVIPSSGNPKTYINGQNNVKLTYSTNVITIAGITTPFATGDIYCVGIRLQDKAYDSDLDILKNILQAKTPNPVTDLEAYTTFAPDDATYDEGAVFEVYGHEYVVFYYSKTASTADNTYVKPIALSALDSAVDYQATVQGSPTAGIVPITPIVYELDKAALVNYIVIPTGGAPYMRIDVAKATDTGTDSTLTTYINKIPRGF